MPEIGFGISSKGTLLEALSAIPGEFLPFVRDGFSRLSKVNKDRWPMILEMVRDAAPYPSNMELEPISAALAMDPTQAASVVSACRILVGILSLRDESPRDFVDAAIESKIIDVADRDAIGAFGDFVAQSRSELKKSLAVSSLQHLLLPSLADVDMRVDIRVDFQAGEITAMAPVVLVHIETDTNNKELWFQMARPQIVALQAKLGRVLEEIKLAELAAAKLVQ